MTHTQSEIIMALKIIKRTCDEHHCEDCPFETRFETGRCGIIATDPTGWRIMSENTRWRALDQKGENKMIYNTAILFTSMWLIVTLGTIGMWFFTEELPALIRKETKKC